MNETERAFDILLIYCPISLFNTKNCPSVKWIGDEGINNITDFFGNASNQRPSIFDPVLVITQCKAYKIFVMKKINNWEGAKGPELSRLEERLRGERSKASTLTSILSKQKLIKTEKLIKKEKESLSRKKKNSFEIMLEQWMTSEYTIWHPDITKVLFYKVCVLVNTKNSLSVNFKR